MPAVATAAPVNRKACIWRRESNPKTMPRTCSITLAKRKSEAVERCIGSGRNLRSMGIAVEDRKDSDKRHGRGYGPAPPAPRRRRERRPRRLSRSRRPESRCRSMPSAPPISIMATKLARNGPERPPAEQGGEEADGHHGERMVEPAEGMQRSRRQTPTPHERPYGPRPARSHQHGGTARRERFEVMGCSCQAAAARPPACSMNCAMASTPTPPRMLLKT